MSSLRFVILFTIVGCSLAKYSGWNSSPSTQYHIQTDEGPERYFRYQTQSGQYRKEKRLQDGTVVGSYGWVDADGYLRLRDYIADTLGYRILKSKTVYVGPQRPIQEALDVSKHVPADAGILVDPGRPQRVKSPTIAVSSTPSTPIITTYRPTPIAYTTPSSTLSPYSPLSTVAPYHESSSTPIVLISPNSLGASTEKPYNFGTASDTVAILKSTIPPYPATTYRPTFRISVPSNDLNDYDDYDPYSSKNHYGQRTSPNALNLDPYSDQGAPIDRSDSLEALPYNKPRYNPNKYQFGSSRNGYRANQLGNGYDPQFPYYDGISVTKNGFRYYLPKQYQEEESSRDDAMRTGSFGYVDPFGIRRVIYYNTAPGTGFQIRKNNRYVGHNGTPYDPRPL